MPCKYVSSIVLTLPLLLSACAGPQPSVEINAHHMTYKIARMHFDPNTRPLTTDNARRMTAFLNPFYQLGKKDRAEGLTLAQAQQRVASFNQNRAGSAAEEGPFAAASQKSTFISQSYDAEQPEAQSKILLEGATATYWDGYNGKS